MWFDVFMCFIVPLSSLHSGDFVDYSALKGEFQRGECFASCQSLALTPSSVKTPPLVHVDTRYSSVADSLRLACYTLNKRDSPQDSSMEVDDLITSMLSSFKAVYLFNSICIVWYIIWFYFVGEY